PMPSTWLLLRSYGGNSLPSGTVKWICLGEIIRRSANPPSRLAPARPPAATTRREPQSHRFNGSIGPAGCGLLPFRDHLRNGLGGSRGLAKIGRLPQMARSRRGGRVV